MIAEKLRRVADNLPLVYEAGKAICKGRHFTEVILGDGTGELRFRPQFEPDIVSVTGFDPAGYNQNNVVAHFHANLSTFGHVCASSSAYNASGGLTSTAMTSAAIVTRCVIEEDGTVVVKDLRGSAVGQEGIFLKDMPYVVVAAWYDKKPLKERITEYVRSLSGSGTARLSKRRVFEAFTQEEWDALIATQPSWTFTLT